MIGSDIISSDYWRNYIPVAPDFTMSALVGSYGELSIKEVLLQGARDFEQHFSPNPLILPDLVDVQRGWLHDIILVNQGKHGVVTLNDFLNGFKFTPLKTALSGTDCFNYQLSNGTQLSNYGKVTVEVINPLIPELKIYSKDKDVYLGRESNSFRMSFDTSIGHSSFFRSPQYKIRWRITRPVAEKDADGVTRVRQKETIISNTDWLFNAHGDCTIVNSGKTLPYTIFKTDRDIAGIDVRTNAPYIPQNVYPSLIVEYVNYPHLADPEYHAWYQPKYDTSKPEVYAFDVVDLFGLNWWRSGKIILE